MINRRLDLWLPTYALTTLSRLQARWRRRNQLTHILFLICDHFEPQHGISTDEQPFERLKTWEREYPLFQARCQAEFGASPMHTWFYPPHHGEQHLATLSKMVFEGLGEVELHYHHNNDTAEKLRKDLQSCIAMYNRWGLLLESGERPTPAFGFIHGDWALDNACGGDFCGVNDELTILQELGCWADFTMPSANRCQSRKINSIYYAEGNPNRSKSHDWGRNARVGLKDPAGLFLMQGPLGINWSAPGYPRIENASLTSTNWGRSDRIDKWLDCNIHVKGRPDWQFVKLHAHGAIERDFDALFGDAAYNMHKTLNERFNDGKKFRLHYVTARQAYNIAKAAEAGKQGDPSQWVDYQIKPQPNSFYVLSRRHDLFHCDAAHLIIRNIEPGAVAELKIRTGPIRRIVGMFSELHIAFQQGTLRIAMQLGAREVLIHADDTFCLLSVRGGTVSPNPENANQNLLRVTVGEECIIDFRVSVTGRVECGHSRIASGESLRESP